MSIVYRQRGLTDLGNLNHGKGPGLLIPYHAQVPVDVASFLLNEKRGVGSLMASNAPSLKIGQF